MRFVGLRHCRSMLKRVISLGCAEAALEIWVRCCYVPKSEEAGFRQTYKVTLASVSE